MILPCINCLKLPICVNSDINNLTPHCEDLKSFIRTKKGMIKVIRMINPDVGQCKLESKGESPKIYIEYY